jgi:hypothetical protein
MAPPPTDSATVDQGSSMRKEHRLDIRRSNAHPSLMSHTRQRTDRAVRAATDRRRCLPDMPMSARLRLALRLGSERFRPC